MAEWASAAFILSVITDAAVSVKRGDDRQRKSHPGAVCRRCPKSVAPKRDGAMVEREDGGRPAISIVRETLSAFEEEVRVMDVAQEKIDGDIAPVAECVLEQLPDRQRLPFRGLLAEFYCMVDPNDELMRWMVDLQFRNMRDVYDATHAWSRETIEFELQHGTFVIAAIKRAPVGYLHMTFEVEGDRVAMDIGTIQIVEHHRHIGLGSAMVTTALQIAKHFGVEEVMAMVPTACVAGLALFRRHRFRAHRSSPEQICVDSQARFRVLYRRAGGQQEDVLEL